VTPASTTSGQVGFSNSGYNGLTNATAGIPVNLDTYQSYFWMKGAYTGTVTIQLVGAASGIVYATSNVSVVSTDSTFTYWTTTFSSAQSPDGNNLWELTFDSSKVASGGSLWFGLPQLFPVTYHARYNGLRNDIATFLEQIGGSFLRFPGGNNM
jgi:alpha-N-arabinofuranosidase